MKIIGDGIRAMLTEDEVNFMSHMSGKPLSFEASYYWELNYGLKPKETLRKLLNEKYLHVATFEESLHFYSAADLREYLKSHEIKTSRKKDDLINSLIANFSIAELRKSFNIEYYAMTELGYAVRLEMFPELASEYDEISAEVKNISKRRVNAYAAVKLKNLQDELKVHLANKDWDLYRCACYEISEIYNKRHEYIIQLLFLCAVCYIDLSGMSDSNYVDPESLATLAPAVLYNLMETKKKLRLTAEQMKEFYLKSVSEINLPHNYYTPIESWYIIEKEYQSYA